MPVLRTIRILILSRDVSLLSSRVNLLTQEGYSADWEVDPERALRRIRTRHYHLVVLSNSFSEEEQLNLRAKVKQTRLEQAVLLLGTDENEGEQFLRSVELSIRQNKGKLSAHLVPLRMFPEREV